MRLFAALMLLAAALSAFPVRAQGGGFSASLTWSAPADLDLAVILPGGLAISWEHPRDYGTGGLREAAEGNDSCTLSDSPAERIIWQEAPPPGDYEVQVHYARACEGQPEAEPVPFQLRVGERLMSGALLPGEVFRFRFSRQDADKLAGFAADVLCPGNPAACADRLSVFLVWEGTADFDLAVTNPAGVVLYYHEPEDNAGGHLHTESGQDGCLQDTAQPYEAASWPSGAAPPGEYGVEVFYASPCLENWSEPHPYRAWAAWGDRIIAAWYGHLAPQNIAEHAFTLDLEALQAPPPTPEPHTFALEWSGGVALTLSVSAEAESWLYEGVCGSARAAFTAEMVPGPASVRVEIVDACKTGGDPVPFALTIGGGTPIEAEVAPGGIWEQSIE